MVEKSLVSRQEAKIRELETRLEFERTQVKRLEVGALLVSSELAELPQQWEPRMCSWAGLLLLQGLCQLSGQLTGRVPLAPPTWPALWAPQSLPALHSVSVLAFCQGTRAA